MFEVFLLMLASAVQSTAALEGGGSEPAYLSQPTETVEVAPAEEDLAETAPAAEPEPVEAPVEVAEPEPVEAPEPAVTAEVEQAPVAAPTEDTEGLVLPSFPPKPEDLPKAEQPIQTAEVAPQTEDAAAPTEKVAENTATQPVFLAPQAAEPSPGLVAEPQVATGRFLTALEVKPILNATKGNWVAVREYAGQDLVYVTHIWSWRCGLLEMRVGLNGAPGEIWPLPPCHVDQPSPAAILDSDGLPYREFPLRSIQIIEVHLTYDDLTTDTVRFNRAGVVIP